MTIMDSSPVTEARARAPQSVRPSSTTSGTSFEIPATPEEARRLLDHVDRLVRDGRMTRAHTRELTRFLGANSGAWTPDNRERLRQVLSTLAEWLLEAVLARITQVPRTDVLDEAELVLALFASTKPNFERLQQMCEQPFPGGVKATLLRAAVRAAPSASVPMLWAALRDPDPEVRDAAATLLGEVGGANSRPLLEQRLERETDDGVRSSLLEALEFIRR